MIFSGSNDGTEIVIQVELLTLSVLRLSGEFLSLSLDYPCQRVCDGRTVGHQYHVMMLQASTDCAGCSLILNKGRVPTGPLQETERASRRALTGATLMGAGIQKRKSQSILHPGTRRSAIAKFGTMASRLYVSTVPLFCISYGRYGLVQYDDPT